MGKKDPRKGHEKAVHNIRSEFEQRHGHTPTETDQRKIERQAEQLAEKYHRRQGGSK